MLPQPGTTHAVGYEEPVGDPVHRSFHLWQQVDGGRRDLFVWVAETSGEGSQNRADPASGTNQGAVAMGFYNMSAGDAPYFRELADTYALSDNYHQPMMGGTGANFQAAATGHAIAYWEEGAWRSRRKTRSRTRTRATHSVRHAHSIDRRLALREERRGRPHLYRPRCDPQIHRGELASRPAIGEEPRPSAQPDRRPV
jgi:phospholipase C